jgi:hypothetical protein
VCYLSFVFLPYIIASIHFAIISNARTFESADFRRHADCLSKLLSAIITQNPHQSSFFKATGTATPLIHIPIVQVKIVYFRTTLPVFICLPVFKHFGVQTTFPTFLCCYWHASCLHSCFGWSDLRNPNQVWTQYSINASSYLNFELAQLTNLIFCQS